MYPRHGKKKGQEDRYIEDPPYFIEEVLEPMSGRTNGHGFNDRCRALLIDLDNGSELSEEAGKELTVKTGTPRYISRAVAQNGFLRGTSAKQYVRMPELSGSAYALYCLAYRVDDYEKYNDKDGTFHGSRMPASTNSDHSETVRPTSRAELLALLQRPQRPQPVSTAPPKLAPSKPFCHRMDHDAESMYWVLFRCLLLARPLGAPDEEDTNLNTTAWQDFSRHTISRSKGNDSRVGFMDWSEGQFQEALHPKLPDLVGKLLLDLTSQVRPEYGYLDPPPPQEHLHEAMRRLLLDAIVQIHDNPELNVELDPNCGRRLIDHDEEPVPPPTGNGKRKAEGQPDYAQGSKRIHSARDSALARSISYAEASESDPEM
ncbi:hypothetical protein K474DRAFT_1042531 [Panus rudis PR-1116 ss-1]|nr:hypothetical protein K474DRAFT_1042531 [Panus rudis PR-1116 ss-1]